MSVIVGIRINEIAELKKRQRQPQTKPRKKRDVMYIRAPKHSSQQAIAQAEQKVKIVHTGKMSVPRKSSVAIKSWSKNLVDKQITDDVSA